MTQPSFTPREREVIQLLSSGKSQKEIASVLGISNKTVNSYIANAKLRVNARTTEQLVAICTRALSAIKHSSTE